MAKQVKQRKVTVLVRYEIKQDCPEKGLHKGDVVLYVENDEGKRYYATLRRNKVHSCTCVGNAEHGKRCYHIKQMVTRENARAETKKPFVFQIGGKEVRGHTAAEALLKALQVVKRPAVVSQVVKVTPVVEVAALPMAA